MILSELKLGQEGRIEAFSEKCPIKIKRRLLDLGFTTGTKVRLVRKSILNKVVLLELRGYVLSLQKKIANYVILGGKNG